MPLRTGTAMSLEETRKRNECLSPAQEAFPQSPSLFCLNPFSVDSIFSASQCTWREEGRLSTALQIHPWTSLHGCLSPRVIVNANRNNLMDSS